MHQIQESPLYIVNQMDLINFRLANYFLFIFCRASLARVHFPKESVSYLACYVIKFDAYFLSLLFSILSHLVMTSLSIIVLL